MAGLRPRHRGAVRDTVKPVSGGQDAALAVEMVRRRAPRDRVILLDDPAMLLLNQLSPIAWKDLILVPASTRWTLLAVFTDPWGQNRDGEPMSICDCCGSVLFHKEAL